MTKWSPPTIRRQGPGAEEWNRAFWAAREKLIRRIEEFRIPPMPYAPGQDVVIIYRLPDSARQEMTEGGIIIPASVSAAALGYGERVHSIGVLLWAGEEAMDVMLGTGYLPGDIVLFARFAGEEQAAGVVEHAIEGAKANGVADRAKLFEIAKKARDSEVNKEKFLRMKISEIHCSVDKIERTAGKNPTFEIVVYGKEGGAYVTRCDPIAK